MGRTIWGFCIALGMILVIDLAMLAMLGLDCDRSALWILLNLPGLPCGLGLILFVRSELAALVVTMVGSCLVWGAVGAGIGWVMGRGSKAER
jgi:hypothetical protein